MPSFCASFGPLISTRWPSHSMVPSSAGPTPEMTFTSVDFPAPLSPTRATTSPGITSISASVRACTAPKRFEMPLNERTGVAVAVAVTMLPLLSPCKRMSRGRPRRPPPCASLLQAGLLAIGGELLRADVADLVEAVGHDGVLDVVRRHLDRREQLRLHVGGAVVHGVLRVGVGLALGE